MRPLSESPLSEMAEKFTKETYLEERDRLIEYRRKLYKQLAELRDRHDKEGQKECHEQIDSVQTWLNYISKKFSQDLKDK